MNVIKLFFITLWYRILHSISPDWIKNEINYSMLCSEHKGSARCDCWEQRILGITKKEYENKEFQAKSHFWYEKQRLSTKVEELEAELFNSKNSAKCWHEAWFDQRDATGRAYWKGYADGKRVAIAFHTNEAAKRRSAANGFSNEKDKASQELDARYHDWSANQIMLQGYDVKNNAHCAACTTGETHPVNWKPEGGLRRGEKDR